jgi:large subunit ribosomal protein L33
MRWRPTGVPAGRWGSTGDRTRRGPYRRRAFRPSPSIVATVAAAVTRRQLWSLVGFSAAVGGWLEEGGPCRLRGFSVVGEPNAVISMRPDGRRPMAKGKKKLEVVHLVCEETGDYNYTLRRKTGGEKLKLKKFSPRLRRHTVHNEKKK